MKICLINNLYPPLSVGGAEQIVALIANKLSETNEVIVLTSTYDGNKEIQTKGKLKIFRLDTGNLYHYLQAAEMPTWRKIIWHFLDIFGCKACKKVKEVLKEERPDVVITHNLKGFSYRTPRLISKLNLKHIHTLHDYQLIDPHGSLFREGKNLKNLSLPFKIYKNICKRLFSTIDVIISPSKFVLEKHLEHGFFKKSKHLIWPNPTNLIEVTKPHQDADKIRLLYLGQIEKHKGIQFFLETFKNYESDKFELLVVGDGSQLKRLKEKYENSKIKFALYHLCGGIIHRL